MVLLGKCPLEMLVQVGNDSTQATHCQCPVATALDQFKVPAYMQKYGAWLPLATVTTKRKRYEGHRTLGGH